MEYLGQQLDALPANPETFRLDIVRNPAPGRLYVARFTVPEFTSLCPVTGQPDYATIVIDYCPKENLVESKSLKLYMTSFRNWGDFHEACTNKIADKFINACDPHWLRILAYWYPRGGIPIDVFVEHGKRPACYTPDVRRDYRGR